MMIMNVETITTAKYRVIAATLEDGRRVAFTAAALDGDSDGAVNVVIIDPERGFEESLTAHALGLAETMDIRRVELIAAYTGAGC